MLPEKQPPRELFLRCGSNELRASGTLAILATVVFAVVLVVPLTHRLIASENAIPLSLQLMTLCLGPLAVDHRLPMPVLIQPLFSIVPPMLESPSSFTGGQYRRSSRRWISEAVMDARRLKAH